MTVVIFYSNPLIVHQSTNLNPQKVRRSPPPPRFYIEFPSPLPRVCIFPLMKSFLFCYLVVLKIKELRLIDSVTIRFISVFFFIFIVRGESRSSLIFLLPLYSSFSWTNHCLLLVLKNIFSVSSGSSFSVLSQVM